MTLIKSRKTWLHQKRYTGAALMDLSKGFDTINQELLIAKLHVYGFSKNSLEVIQVNYQAVINAWWPVQRLVLGENWFKGYLKVPHLGQFYSIFIKMIYFFLLKDTDIFNLADDTLAYAFDVNLELVLEKVEGNSEVAVIWFKKNYMKLNTICVIW